MVQSVLLVLLVASVQRVHKVLRAALATLDSQVHVVPLDRLVHKETLEALVL